MVWEGLGAASSVFGLSFSIWGEDCSENRRQDTHKIQSWRQVGAGTAQDGLCSRQDSEMVISGSDRWSLLGEF